MKKTLTNNLGLKVFALLLAVLLYHFLKTGNSTMANTGNEKDNDRTFLKYFKY